MESRSWERHWQKYEAIDFLRNSEQLTHPSRTMIADEAVKIGGTVLECGSATCIDYPLYVERGLKYAAIDITPKYIDRACELYPDIDARVASILSIPFPTDSFDTVYCRAVLEHLHPDEWPIAIREMWRVASKQMIICLYQRPVKGGYVSWKVEGGIPISFVVNNPAIQATISKADLKVKFDVRGDDEPRSKDIVFAVPIPLRKLLELIEDLPRMGGYRHLESPRDGRHTVHYLYIASKMPA